MVALGGTATQGNGGEVTKRHLEDGDTVICIGRNMSKLEQLKYWYGDQLIPFKMDLSTAVGIPELIETIRRTGMLVDRFYHLAGSPIIGDPDDVTTEYMQAARELHVHVPVEIADTILDEGLFAQDSVAAMVSSTGSALPQKGTMGAYNKIKAEMNHWYAANQWRYRQDSVRLMLVLMGMVKTGMLDTPETRALFKPKTQAYLDKMAHTPAQCVDVIMADIAAGADISYPGWRAKCATWSRGKARVRWSNIREVIKMAYLLMTGTRRQPSS